MSKSCFNKTGAITAPVHYFYNQRLFRKKIITKSFSYKVTPVLNIAISR